MEKFRTDSINKFLETKIDDSLRNELGKYSFLELRDQLSQIASLLKRALSVIDSNDIHEGILTGFDRVVKEFNGILSEIASYNFENDARNNYNTRQILIKRVLKYCEDSLGGNNKFLTCYTAIMQFNFFNDKKEIEDFKKLKTEYIFQKEEVDKLVQQLSKAAAEKSVSDYSIIFEEQADKHSIMKLKIAIGKGENIFRLGAAQKWLVSGFAFISLLLIFLFFSERILPIVDAKNQINYAHIFTRLLFLSLVVFLIGFAFKQYSVNKHLHTLNKHRQNALNSFNIFIKSSEDPVIRNTLVLEVAKAIYEQSQTGYLPSKNETNSLPSIIELTRTVQGKS